MLKKTAVIGAGLMGGQVAALLASGSEETVLMSRKQSTIDATMRNIQRYLEDLHRYELIQQAPAKVIERIHTTTSLDEAAAKTELVVESITEDLDTKKDVFKRLDQVTDRNAILASNTSGLPITKLAEATESPERVIGSHFIQPAHIVPLVEVVKGEKTSDETIHRTVNAWRALGKSPLVVRIDIAGFILDRIQQAMVREAVFLLLKGVAKAEDIDLAITLGLAPRLTISGPLEQRDINGIDVTYRTAKHLWKQLGGWEDPLKFLEGKVNRGELGLTTGKGYYDWTGRDPTEIRSARDNALIQCIKYVVNRKLTPAQRATRSL